VASAPLIEYVTSTISVHVGVTLNFRSSDVESLELVESPSPRKSSRKRKEVDDDGSQSE